MARHKGIWLGAILAALILVSVSICLRMAVRTLETEVEQALGPESEIKAIRVGFTGVHLEGLRIKGTGKWPARDTLRADRVTLMPSMLSLFSGQFRVRSITIDRPYLSVFKTRGGKILVVPSLLKKDAPQTPRGTSPSSPAVLIGRITLHEGVMEFFDASVSRPWTMTRLEQIHADIRHLRVPAFTGKSDFTLTGVSNGVHGNGNVEIKGWAELATMESSVAVHLSGIDMVGLQPYLSRSGDVKVTGGSLDLTVESEVHNKGLNAPGRLVISDLELGPSRGLFGTFMGVPRDVVLNFLKDRDNRIILDFVLKGDLNNPRFTLHEAFSERLAVSMAETLGVSVKGLAEGAGTLGQKGVQAAGDVVKGVEDAARQIFSGK